MASLLPVKPSDMLTLPEKEELGHRGGTQILAKARKGKKDFNKRAYFNKPRLKSKF